MEILLLWAGRLAGLAGVLICGWAAFHRLSGDFYAGGFQVGTLLLAGIAAMVFACVLFLMVLTNRPRR
jgi:hypothetical protein